MEVAELDVAERDSIACAPVASNKVANNPPEVIVSQLSCRFKIRSPEIKNRGW